MWFKTNDGWKDVPLKQFVRPGVPWIEHPNKAVCSHIYSELLALGVFVHAPEKGREVTIRFPIDLDSEIQRKIKDLANKLGFNGVLMIKEIRRESETILTVIIDE